MTWSIYWSSGKGGAAAQWAHAEMGRFAVEQREIVWVNTGRTESVMGALLHSPKWTVGWLEQWGSWH
jgi:hypothetical protein